MPYPCRKASVSPRPRQVLVKLLTCLRRVVHLPHPAESGICGHGSRQLHPIRDAIRMILRYAREESNPPEPSKNDIPNRGVAIYRIEGQRYTVSKGDDSVYRFVARHRVVQLRYDDIGTLRKKAVRHLLLVSDSLENVLWVLSLPIVPNGAPSPSCHSGCRCQKPEVSAPGAPAGRRREPRDRRHQSPRPVCLW